MTPAERALRAVMFAEIPTDLLQKVQYEIEVAEAEARAEERAACLGAVQAADCEGPECHLCGCKEAAVVALRARGAHAAA